MTHEGTGEEGHAHLGAGGVAVLPGAPVERVEIHGFAGQDADGMAAADDLAVGAHVGADAEELLHAAGRETKAGDDFVEDEVRCRFLR